MGSATDLSPNEPEDEPRLWAAQVAAALESAKQSLAYRISSEDPFRLAPCGQDTDCQLRLRTPFAGEKLGIIVGATT